MRTTSIKIASLVALIAAACGTSGPSADDLNDKGMPSGGTVGSGPRIVGVARSTVSRPPVDDEPQLQRLTQLALRSQPKRLVGRAGDRRHVPSYSSRSLWA